MIPAALLAILILGAFATIALACARLLAGPSQTDRIIALDILLAAAIALCLLAALDTARAVFLDVAIGLALAGFIATLGWARLIERSNEEES